MTLLNVFVVGCLVFVFFSIDLPCYWSCDCFALFDGSVLLPEASRIS